MKVQPILIQNVSMNWNYYNWRNPMKNLLLIPSHPITILTLYEEIRCPPRSMNRITPSILTSNSKWPLRICYTTFQYKNKTPLVHSPPKLPLKNRIEAKFSWNLWPLKCLCAIPSPLIRIQIKEKMHKPILLAFPVQNPSTANPWSRNPLWTYPIPPH